MTHIGARKNTRVFGLLEQTGPVPQMRYKGRIEGFFDYLLPVIDSQITSAILLESDDKEAKLICAFYFNLHKDVYYEL
jgi:hypothetical protein